MLQGLYILGDHELIYKSADADIRKHVHMVAPPQTKESIAANPALLQEVDVIFSGWGCPLLDESFLSRAPKLKAIFYGSGSIRALVTDAFWERGIPITSAYAANAVPVAEYAFAQISLSLKRAYYYAHYMRKHGTYPDSRQSPGAYGSTVGIISLGMIGKMVCEKLKSLSVRVIAYDPYCSEEQAGALGVELCSLEQVFERSDVVSLHTPLIPETVGLIGGDHFERMKPNATFINTSRGAVIREEEMIGVLRKRQDLWALLDVTHPEPPAPGSDLYTLDNVVLTPHIAGSVDAECQRMGEYMLEELRRYIDGIPLKWAIDREQAKRMA